MNSADLVISGIDWLITVDGQRRVIRAAALAVKDGQFAAIGKTDDEALFYLRSRGIAAQDARDLIVYAFASEVVERIGIGPLKHGLEKEVFDWLEQARAARR